MDKDLPRSGEVVLCREQVESCCAVIASRRPTHSCDKKMGLLDVVRQTVLPSTPQHNSKQLVSLTSSVAMLYEQICRSLKLIVSRLSYEEEPA